MLISGQSFDREVVVLTALNSNGAKYTVVDGADPKQKDRRNQLFGISGIQAKYPQFFTVKGYSTTPFWVGWDEFQFANDSKSIAHKFGGVESPRQEAPTKYTTNLEEPKYLVLLINLF